jgi:hypothetical protein
MSDFASIHQQAHEAGMAAVESAQVAPMIVGSPSTPLGNDIDPKQRVYYVADGVCGFAWIVVKGNDGFGRWACKQGIARDGYKCKMIWVSQFNQSMQKKEAYASAYAKVVRDAGYSAYSESRMD